MEPNRREFLIGMAATAVALAAAKVMATPPCPDVLYVEATESRTVEGCALCPGDSVTFTVNGPDEESRWALFRELHAKYGGRFLSGEEAKPFLRQHEALKPPRLPEYLEVRS